MTDLWQQIVVAAAVILAAGWLVADGIRRRRKKAACAQCALANPTLQASAAAGPANDKASPGARRVTAPGRS